MSEQAGFTTAAFGPITVVRFHGRTILEDRTIDEMGDHLLGLVSDDGRRQLVLNFAPVESMTSAMIGKLFALHKRVREAGGRLAFCEVGPFLHEIFKVVRLSDFVGIYPTETEALRTFDQAERAP